MKLSQLFREQGKSSPTNISRGIFSLKNSQGNIFPQKFSGEYFPKIPRRILSGNLTSRYLCLQIQEASQIIISKKRRVRGNRGKIFSVVIPKGKIFPAFSPKGEIFPSFSQKRKIFPLGRIFPIEGKIPSLGNIFSFGNIFLFYELFLFRENIHPVGKYSYMGTFLTFTGKFPPGDTLE